jgi:predicted small integral membrane protein
MDTTFLDASLMGRAVTHPILWHLSYAAIILGEGLTGIAFDIAAVAYGMCRQSGTVNLAFPCEC